ncbi:MAG: DUF4405 domain-containing protein [Oscillospiraceae bacterium]|nr:DUF4405 domain-containing protein [Oscillospiraceae bacterium]
MQNRKQYDFRKIIDGCMLVLLLCLMAFQVTGEENHEWIGIFMVLTVVIHQILNRKWYAALFKGKYNPYRSVTAGINLLLMAAMALTAFSGMTMSGYAVPFLYWAKGVFVVRPMHLAMSHWTFLLMGLHLGLHVPLMLGKLKMKESIGTAATILFAVVGGIGFWLFLKNGIPSYLFFRVPFAFFDYEKAAWLVFLENLLMLFFWVFVGAQIAVLCLKKKNASKQKSALVIGSIVAAAVLGFALHMAFL